MRRSLIIGTHASSCYFRTSVEGDLHETRQLSLTDNVVMTLTLHTDATPLETGDPAGTEAATVGTPTLF